MSKLFKAILFFLTFYTTVSYSNVEGKNLSVKSMEVASISPKLVEIALKIFRNSKKDPYRLYVSMDEVLDKNSNLTKNEINVIKSYLFSYTIQYYFRRKIGGEDYLLKYDLLKRLEFLIEFGADPKKIISLQNRKNIWSINGFESKVSNTFLQGVGYNDLKLIKYLISKDVYLNGLDNKGNSALHLHFIKFVTVYNSDKVRFQKWLDVTKVILELTLSLTKRNDEGFTPLDYLRMRDHSNKRYKKLLKVLNSKGVKDDF